MTTHTIMTPFTKAQKLLISTYNDGEFKELDWTCVEDFMMYNDIGAIEDPMFLYLMCVFDHNDTTMVVDRIEEAMNILADMRGVLWQKATEEERRARDEADAPNEDIDEDDI